MPVFTVGETVRFYLDADHGPYDAELTAVRETEGIDDDSQPRPITHADLVYTDGSTSFWASDVPSQDSQPTDRSEPSYPMFAKILPLDPSTPLDPPAG